MIKKLYRDEFETALRDAPVGSIVIDDDGDVFQFTGTECGFVLRSYSLTLKEGSYGSLADVVAYPVMLIEMGSCTRNGGRMMNTQSREAVLNYLTKVWEEATVPQGTYIPAGTVVIHRRDDRRPDYHVRTVLADLVQSSFANIRIVSSPPPKVGFYMQEQGHAYYWDGSVWRYSKGGPRSAWQGYGFSNYIGGVRRTSE